MLDEQTLCCHRRVGHAGRAGSIARAEWMEAYSRSSGSNGVGRLVTTRVGMVGDVLMMILLSRGSGAIYVYTAVWEADNPCARLYIE